ncbi:peroxide stress protein YaaA [Streptococcus dentiloxodontae]
MLTFLIPSAKEMKVSDETFPHFLSEKSSAILQEMLNLSTKELAQAYKIKPESAKKEAKRWQEMTDGAPAYPAIRLFNGLMYRNIKRDNLSKAEQHYLANQVLIASSFYGIISAFEAIAEHRHDFHTRIKVDGRSLKFYWRDTYDQVVSHKDSIISLLSNEFEEVFSKSVRDSFVRVKFMENKAGKLQTHSTISKKARGQFLTVALENQIETVEALKAISFNGFHYQKDLSAAHQLVFVKTI